MLQIRKKLRKQVLIAKYFDFFSEMRTYKVQTYRILSIKCADLVKFILR